MEGGSSQNWDVLHVNSSTFRDIVEKGGAPSVKLLSQNDVVLPNWICLPKLLDNMFQKIQKMIYFGLPNQCFSCKKIGHLAKDSSKKGEGFRYIFELCLEREKC